MSCKLLAILPVSWYLQKITHGFASLSSGSESHELRGGGPQPGSREPNPAPASRAPVCPNYLSGSKQSTGASLRACVPLAAGLVQMREKGRGAGVWDE